MRQAHELRHVSCPVQRMVGKTLRAITGMELGSEEVCFETTVGQRFYFEHFQDCCESVYLAEWDGDPNWLIGQPILVCEQVSHEPNHRDDWGNSYTWTFYNISTINGTVQLRFYGESNGYYSEEVCFTTEANVADHTIPKIQLKLS